MVITMMGPIYSAHNAEMDALLVYNRVYAPLVILMGLIDQMEPMEHALAIRNTMMILLMLPVQIVISLVQPVSGKVSIIVLLVTRHLQLCFELWIPSKKYVNV